MTAPTLGPWHSNVMAKSADLEAAELARRHGGVYVIGPPAATARYDAAYLADLGLVGIYREVSHDG